MEGLKGEIEKLKSEKKRLDKELEDQVSIFQDFYVVVYECTVPYFIEYNAIQV